MGPLDQPQPASGTKSKDEASVAGRQVLTDDAEIRAVAAWTVTLKLPREKRDSSPFCGCLRVFEGRISEFSRVLLEFRRM